MTRWEGQFDLDSVIDELLATSQRLSESSVPHQRWRDRQKGDSSLAEIEKRNGYRLPDDLRRFFNRVLPGENDADWNYDPLMHVPLVLPDARPILENEFGREFLDRERDKKEQFALEHLIHSDPDLHVLDEFYVFAVNGEISPRWLDTPLIHIGQGHCGHQSILYCPMPPDRPTGSIMVWHDDVLTELYVGDSFVQWLARYVACGCKEYTPYPEEAWDLSPDLADELMADHLRLNPDDEEMKRRQKGQCLACGEEMKGITPTCKACGKLNECYP